MKDVKKHLSHSNELDFEQKVKNLLLYRKIVKAEATDKQTAVLTLDNGTKLILEGNEGCCGCGSGCFYIDELNGCDNAIMKVECVCEQKGEYEESLMYHIFVYTEDKKINAVQYSGFDNGYYGTGYDLYVKVDGADEVS